MLKQQEVALIFPLDKDIRIHTSASPVSRMTLVLFRSFAPSWVFVFVVFKRMRLKSSRRLRPERRPCRVCAGWGSVRGGVATADAHFHTVERFRPIKLARPGSPHYPENSGFEISQVKHSLLKSRSMVFSLSLSLETLLFSPFSFIISEFGSAVALTYSILYTGTASQDWFVESENRWFLKCFTF